MIEFSLLRKKSSNLSTSFSDNWKLIVSFSNFRFLYFIFLSFRAFLKEISLFCNFCLTTGLESTSSNKYEPPCRSRPRLTFFDDKKLSSFSTKFAKENNDKKNYYKINDN